ncbi:transketolase [Candidatus Desantisbacteria bacterium CG_4_10_14_0_8_um_filter_48_22]|uniref:Transketolase n=1 Tax=Candidatus Desantisbacteria bacterium CG_4_10_14_0_8_um_filter_48_22 TaxID=1974543 RepID=A0A2M7SAV1_9BACT|nr:MAG: transketolase [Candidatus Desantisbacteria bacterium CG1_02_49_89]PIV54916.1 MAG: transketolase [Candidatus Desantisbacteria bacterium CG02_land_8_20_14_3_00_49_13]PIZ16638.1 MAG: transketolase [Candidatus Desantisbacteria bacterium CG_4_10_14_0_8_um_filter_48_22]PJB28782.1 MAG: transketolase [Candidatus Desantisbacteria bacterium CG_4_9_14_3_um_filter_50_7]
MEIATRDAYGKALADLGLTNPNIVVLDADLSKSTKTVEFCKAFPDRFFNMGVAEANMIGTAAGLATCGKIAFASTFAVFATGRVYDQIRMCLCYPKTNVKICATHAGISVGEDGASHQSNEDIALMRVLPNMTVIVPADGVETEKAVAVIAEYAGPVYLRLGRLKLPVIFSQDYKFEIGRGVQLKGGADVSIIACGLMVHEALKASEELLKEGIRAGVVNMSSVKPLDEALVARCAKETGALVTAEEHMVTGGLGDAVSEVACRTHPVPVIRVGVTKFGESGSPKELLEKYGLTAGAVAGACREAIRMKK